jgi:predicted ATPase
VQIPTTKPVLMMFDDLHWTDPSSQELLDRLMGQVVGLAK